MSQNIRVVVADDSPFVCRFLASQLHSSPGLEVVGTALSGARAVELTRELRPDVVTLAIQMPDMSGLEALERIMQECPTPVLMVSGISRQAAEATLEAIDLGAVDFIFKYSPDSDIHPEALFQEIISKVRAASKIRVVRSLPPHSTEPLQAAEPQLEEEPQPDPAPAAPGPGPGSLGGVVVIGASTGGPVAVRELLAALPPDFLAAVLVVQHMPSSFTRVFAEQLRRQVPLSVREAKQGDHLQSGLVLVAPGDFHTLLRSDSRVRLVEGRKIAGYCPSIDATMQSVVQVYGARTSGVLLTGMGEDGVKGLLSIRALGGQTYAQDAASCVVKGMPQLAADRGAADQLAPPAEIGRRLAAALAKAQKRSHAGSSGL